MIIGTRGSELATTQTNTVANILNRKLGITAEISVIQTLGDRVTDRPLREIEGSGYFTKELEDALLTHKIDIAVHSYKDMPSKCPHGLTVAAVSEREDVADLLIIHPSAYRETHGTIAVSSQSVVGTSAVRRETQVRALRPDIITKDLRGNVPTRISKLRERKYDAIFLASAGVRRLKLDLSDLIVVRLDPTFFVPSPGQGALAVQMRENDPRLSEVRNAIHNNITEIATQIERGVQSKFGGGCGLPLGVYAVHSSNNWTVYGFWGGNPEAPVWAKVDGNKPNELIDELFYALSRLINV